MIYTIEIKMRAWDKDKREMKQIEISQTFDPKLKFMQFTGVKDKYDKEICEGDIILFDDTDDRKEIVIVEYEQSEACFFLILTELNSEEDSSPNIDLSYFYKDKYEIIGFIYENLD